MAGTVKASVIQNDVSGSPTLFKDVTNTEVGQLCRTWGKIDASSGTPTSSRSFNISSLVDNGTGDIGINFTNALISSDYAVTAGTSNATYVDMINIFDYPNGYYTAPTTTYFRVTTYGQASYRDIKAFMFSIFV